MLFWYISAQSSSVAQSCPTLCNPMNCSTPGFPVHYQVLELAQTRPLSRWWHPTISPSVVSFSSCLQSFPASGSFPMSRLFTSGRQSIGASASASVLPVNIQGWFPWGLTGWISLQSKGLSSLLQHHSSKASVLQCSAFLWSNSHIHTWLPPGKALSPIQSPRV